MHLEERISIQYTNLTKTDKKIIKKLLENPDFLISKSVQEASSLLDASPAAIVRLAKKIGYKGIADLKNSLEIYSRKKISQTENPNLDTKEQVLETYTKNIEMISYWLDTEQIKLVAEIIVSARDIKILGIGSSGLSAEQMVYFLLYQDIYAESITSKTKMYYLSRTLSKDTVLVVYTVSINNDYKELFEAALAAGTKVIIITMNGKKKLFLKNVEVISLPSNTINFNQDIKTVYQLDNRSIFMIFSEILSAIISQLV
ncbi:MurR/RpiR family transcriptional regulator [Streptococcus hyovaginalis]|uniref:MurR/RpiR family transcriptional regulator n=1 Tax=Streptococcus hyovaginalis TaxID=149015 RepID=UPI002A839CC4|nr:MurR/RpiR family transcriptional regulator [Streptococcus hyovaginalis]MDY4511560.1 MurR/RpiR family transcriptional regulator [Streptococcus hyovaginalis]